MLFSFSVLIITSSINAPETIEVLNQMKNLTHTKALIIDIIGSILNNQNGSIQTLNNHKDNNLLTNSNNNLLVLTILTDRFKVVLNYSFHDDFEKLFNDVDVNGNSDVGDEFFSLIKNIFNRGKLNRSDEVVTKIQKYVRDSCDKCGNSIRAHISYCEAEVKRAQQSPSDGNIISVCEDIFKEIDTRQTSTVVLDRTRTSIALHQNVNLIFGDFFSLFDFITSETMQLPGNTDVNIKYDFIVLDSRILTYGMNKMTFSWRPYLVLQQNQIFTTHRVSPASNDWFHPSILWTCGLQCWIITTLALILFLISMVVSIAVGIAVR